MAGVAVEEGLTRTEFTFPDLKHRQLLDGRVDR